MSTRFSSLLTFTIFLTTGILVLSGCAQATSFESEKPRVLTTFTVLQDMAQNVAGEYIEVDSLTKPGAEIHEYEPTPSDIRKAHNADLVLDNGLNLENWFKQFIEVSNAKHITVSDGVEPIAIAEGDAASTPNPHAWMSPVNAQIYVDNIARAFAALDPEHAQQFYENASNYKQKLESLHRELLKELAPLEKSKRTLVTCEGAFSYLARDAGLGEEYLWAVNSDAQAAPAHVSRVIESVKTQQIPAVFCESTASDHVMKQVSHQTGAAFGGVLYVDSLSEHDGPVPTYIDLLKHDTQTIARGLNGNTAKTDQN